jgi:hypothetical protein
MLARVVEELPAKGDRMSTQEDWNQYLNDMTAKHGDLGQALARFWDYAKILNAPVPCAAPSEDDTTFHVAWDMKQFHLDVDIIADGSWEWFFRNRKTEGIDGGTDADKATFEYYMKEVASWAYLVG